MSFAIIETGGKQYKVSTSKILEIEKLDAKKGETIKFKNVLIPEINMGQLIKIIRSEYLVDAKGLNQVNGKPISASRIIEKVNEMVG